MEMQFIVVVLSIGVVGAIILLSILMWKQFRSPTPDFKNVKKDIRISFSVAGSVVETREKVLSGSPSLKPGPLGYRDETIVAYGIFNQPGNFYVVYLSQQDGGRTLVDVGVYSQAGHDMATYGLWYGQSLKDFLTASN